MKSESSQSLAGKSALVSGGGTGIGRAIALALAGEGAVVRITGRRERELQEVASHARERISPVVCDIRDAESWKAVIEADPNLDIMVNNAAVSVVTDLLGMNAEPWERIFNTNFLGTLHGCREAARLMRANGGGRIINITSIHGRLCERGSSGYGIAKAAIEQWTRCLAVELAEYGILVNAVAPGFIDTPMSRATGINELETDWFKTNYLNSGRIPLRRSGRPEEIAAAVLFLASQGNTYMTGQVLTVDGGLSLTL